MQHIKLADLSGTKVRIFFVLLQTITVTHQNALKVYRKSEYEHHILLNLEVEW